MNMDKATQKSKILAFCELYGSITVRDAFEKLNINSPTKRISELRASGGYDIETFEESNVNASGETVRYNRYFIRKRVADNG
jgi:hypothetical protein